MNRHERRAAGLTSPRVYKNMVKQYGRQAVMSIDPRLLMAKLVNLDPREATRKDAERHVSRLQGKPRRWQVERARRRDRQ